MSGLNARVMRSLAITRKEKLNFPGVFMGLSGVLRKKALELTFDDDPLFRDGRGELSWPALGVLLDVALGAVTRIEWGPALRPATVHLHLQMTGAPAREAVVTRAQFAGLSERTRTGHMLSTCTVHSGKALIARASGAFVMVDLPHGETQMPLPWARKRFGAPALDRFVFDDHEREALKCSERAERTATEAHPFIEHFWCGVPGTGEGKARLVVPVGPHLGNRVGQVHGGILFGAAASVASAAVPASMRLSNISAWFLSPGQRPRLTVRSVVVQQGRTVAVVRTRITGASGKLVLEATSQHVAATS